MGKIIQSCCLAIVFVCIVTTEALIAAQPTYNGTFVGTLSNSTISGATTNSGTISGGTIAGPTLSGTVAGSPTFSGSGILSSAFATNSALGPVYKASGAENTDATLHFVFDSFLFSANPTTVTLSGSAAYSNTATYTCVVTSGGGFQVNQNIQTLSGSQFNFANGNIGQGYVYICLGS